MLRVAVIGSGNWGTAAARLIAMNIKKYPEFHDELFLWVHEEIHQEMEITKSINIHNENHKYLPGIKLPKNIQAVITYDLKDIDILVFCLPHQFLSTLKQFHFKKDAIGISLSKGLIVEDGSILTPSEYISSILGLKCSCLSGPNIANEVAADMLSESTLGVTDGVDGETLLKLFNSDTFIVYIRPYSKSLELAGALKNTISLAYGMAEGVGCGSNTLVMLFRRGICEIKQICEEMKDSVDVLDPSCIGDLYVSCHSGRNYKCGVEIGRRNISYKEYEESMNGQKLQGPDTTKSIVEWLGEKKEEYPILSAVNEVCNNNALPMTILDALKRK